MIDRSAPAVAMVATNGGAPIASPEVASAADLAISDADPGSTERSMVDAVVANPPFGRYAGGKNGAGVYQRLINMMPPHRVYIEAFLGSGAVIRRKRRAIAANVGIDVDGSVIDTHVAEGLAPRMLIGSRWREWEGDELVYCDPPYLGSARCSPTRDCYRHEMKGEAEHTRLLRILTSLPAMVMVSGYASELYDQALKDWRRVTFMAQTRGGPKEEVVWMNYPEPKALHDYSYLGEDFHDRCRIARKIKRWTRKLAGLPVLERAAVIDAIGVTAGEHGHG